MMALTTDVTDPILQEELRDFIIRRSLFRPPAWIVFLKRECIVNSDQNGRVDPGCFFELMMLPRELRDAIYHLAMKDQPTRYKVMAKAGMSELTVSRRTLPPLCFVSKQIHREGMLTQAVGSRRRSVM